MCSIFVCYIICFFFMLWIVRPKMIETTALGAALAAGFAVDIWSMHNAKSDYDTFTQTTTGEGNFISQFYKFVFIVFYN